MRQRTRWLAGGVALGLVAVAGGVTLIATLGDSASAATACGLTDPAFCETFDVAKPDTTTRTGDLDESYWGVSRVRRAEGSGDNDSPWVAAALDGANVLPPNDVRIHDGTLHEAVNDSDGETVLAMYPKQPWDILNRTGIATFQVGNDAQNEHAAWPEFWWTDQPVPAPTGTQDTTHPGIQNAARNSVGVLFAEQCTSAAGGSTGNTTQWVGVSSIQVTSNYSEPKDLPMTVTGCVKKGDHDHLNTYQIRASINRIEVWGSDPGGTLKMLAFSNSTLPMTRGVIWINDVHYNANKFGTQGNHEFVWDNVGFDGPAPYRDLTYDVKDKSPTSLGYDTPATFTVNGVAPTLTPTGAFVNLNWFALNKNLPQVSVNGGAYSTMTWPSTWTQTFVERTVAIPITGWVNGTNTIAVKIAGGSTGVSNINLVLIAAAPVPGAPPPTTTTATTVPSTTSTIPSTTSTIPSTTTTIPATTTTVAVPDPVFYPADYQGAIFVGTQQVNPNVTSPPPTTVTPTTTPATTTPPTTATPTTAAPTTLPATTTPPTTAGPTTTQGQQAHFGMLPVGAALPSDATCAARVRPATETRPDNTTANHTKSNGSSAGPSSRYNRVTGNFTGTTDEIIQWAACKWGIDEDYVRAQAVIESYWHQNALSDWGSTAANCAPGHPIGSDPSHPGQCPESVGLLQVRYPYWGWAFPGAQVSSAYNLDASLAARRACFEGDETWLNTVDRGKQYAAGDIVGCMGMWFSGRWYTAAANDYISRWQGYLNARTWAQPGF